MNSQTLEKMRRDQELCDAVLRVEGTEFKVHKLVLCSCSPFFRSLFTLWPDHDSEVYDIPNISADTMKTILEFVYTGVVTVTENNIHDLFFSADRYDIPGITQACCKVMVDNLTLQTCIGMWRFTHTFYYPELRHKAFRYILKNFKKVVARSEFLCLSVDDVLKIIESDGLNVKHESTVFEAILRWISHAPEERMKYFSKLLSNVRLALMNPEYFQGHVCGSELVRTNRKCRPILMKTLTLMLNLRTRTMNASVFPSRLARPRLPQAVLMAVGGWSIDHPTKSIETYNSVSNRWMDVGIVDKVPQAYHGTVFLNGSVYVIGGFNGNEQFNTTHKYDLANHFWKEVAPMHSRRCFVSVALLDGFIYAMGGRKREERLRTAEKYDPQTNQWTMIASMIEKRSDASSTVFRRKIYICGGFNGAQYLSSTEVYNPLRDRWSMIAQMSSPRSGLGVIAYGKRIYAVGGFTGESRLKSVEVYNPQTNTWCPAPSMLNRRSNFGIAVFDDRLFVVGGHNGIHSVQKVESFDVKTGLWSEERDMLFSRSAFSCCVVSDLPNMADYAALHSTPPENNLMEA